MQSDRDQLAAQLVDSMTELCNARTGLEELQDSLRGDSASPEFTEAALDRLDGMAKAMNTKLELPPPFT